ncbi:MAG: arsenate reductase ArsC [Planctomycetes bacterium]|nr:arsenate reductase ArsC [Planctomycetota bacterium]
MSESKPQSRATPDAHPNRERVLFLCTENSSRSQMAEVILKELAGNRFEVRSAGLAPKDVHPLTHEVLRERGFDTTELRSKALADFMGNESFRFAIIVCDRAAEVCPRIFPFALQTLVWPFEDPALVEGPHRAQLMKFRQVRDQIEARLREWLDNDLA